MSDEQRFHRGDRVYVAADLGETMRHFEAGAEAIVIGSYADQYGGSDRHMYTLMFVEHGGTASWYYDQQLTLVRHGTEDDIRAVIAEREARQVHERDVAWIAQNWATIREKTPGATADELMRRVGISNPWGSQGEGMAYYANWQQTFAALDPILSAMPTDPAAAIGAVRLNPIDVRIE